MPSAKKQLQYLDRRIAALKAERDALLQQSGIEGEQLKSILRQRSPQQTLCQMLRDLYDVVTEEQRVVIGRCLLAAKKMDAKLVEYAGQGYARGWYD